MAKSTLPFHISLSEIDVFLDQLEVEHLGKRSFSRPLISNDLIPKLDSKISMIWIELTKYCNLRCLHCYAESGPIVFNPNTVAKDKWVDVVRDAYDLGCRSIQFIGGEPFLVKPLLYSLISTAKEIGYQNIEVYTNATLIYDTDVSFLRDNNISIAVSIYGKNAQIHDKITSVKGSFEQTEKTIRKLINNNIHVRIGIIEMAQNSFVIKETVNYFHNLGVSKIKVDLVRPSGRGCSDALLTPYLIDKQTRNKASFDSCPWEKFQRAITGHNCFLNKICLSGDGSVFPCIMERRITLGNINTSSFKEILDSDLTKQMRFLTKDKIKMCQDCEYRYCCFDCRVMAPTLYDKPANCLYNPYKGQWNTKRKREEVIKNVAIEKSNKI